MPTNNQRGRPASALQMKHHVGAGPSRRSTISPVTQKGAQLDDGDAEAEERAAVSRGPMSAEKSASASPTKHRKANGLEYPTLKDGRRSVHQ